MNTHSFTDEELEVLLSSLKRDIRLSKKNQRKRYADATAMESAPASEYDRKRHKDLVHRMHESKRSISIREKIFIRLGGNPKELKQSFSSTAVAG